MREAYFDPTIIEPKKSEEETKGESKKLLAKEMLAKFYARIKEAEKFLKDAYKFYTEPVTAKSKGHIKSTFANELYTPIHSPFLTIEPEKREMEKIVETPETIEATKNEKVSSEQKMIIESTEDKSEYESIVTKNYFEGWENLEINGNPNLKDTIKKNILQAEKYHKFYYDQLATELEITVEELKNRLQAKVENLVNASEFWRATKLDVLEKVLNVDGRFKTQFETNTSEGILDPTYRGGQEHKMFGIENDAQKDKDKRPIYGFLSDHEHGAINSAGTIPPPTNVVNYGAINVKLKNEIVYKKGTITFCDSLSPADSYPPTPAGKPHFTSVPYYDIKTMLKKSGGTSVANWGESYTEAQYHGQLTVVDDVESIHVSTSNGLLIEEVERVKSVFRAFKKKHPESTVTLIEF